MKDWQTVPKVLTDDMRRAFLTWFDTPSTSKTINEEAEKLWHAMLAVAPTPAGVDAGLKLKVSSPDLPTELTLDLTSVTTTRYVVSAISNGKRVYYVGVIWSPLIEAAFAFRTEELAREFRDRCGTSSAEVRPVEVTTNAISERLSIKEVTRAQG